MMQITNQSKKKEQEKGVKRNRNVSYLHGRKNNDQISMKIKEKMR